MANLIIGISQREVVVSDSKNWREIERERELWFPLLQQIKSSQYRMLMLPATAGVWHGWHGIIWSCVVFGFNMFQLFFPLYNLIIGAHRRGHQMVHRQRARIIGTIGRRKFRSETSDNMDSWKAEVRRVRREKIRRKKMQVREKVGTSWNTESRQTLCFPNDLGLRRVEK